MNRLCRLNVAFFLAAWSVYAAGALQAAPAGGAGGGGGGKTPVVVSVLDDVLAAPATAKPEVVESGGPPKAGAGKVTADASGTFTIDVSDTDITKVLRMLGAESQKNIIPSRDVRGVVSVSLHNVTVKEALDAILTANGYAYREKGNFIYVYTQKELADLQKAERVMVTEVLSVHYIPAATVVPMIKPLLSPEAQVSFTPASKAGIESSQSQAGGNDPAGDEIIVVRDYQDAIDRVKKHLKQIDRRPQQILVEAVIMRAALSNDNALGVDFTVLGGVDFAGVAAADAKSSDVLSGSIVNNPAAGKITDSGYAAGGTGFTTGAKGLPTGGLRVGLVKNNLAMFISALEEATSATVLANPKILALNKQKGEVIVGKKTGYLTTTVTDTTAIQTVEFLETGTRLIFRPFVGGDGYIRMEIHPEDSDGGLINNLPVKTTTEITTNVMVRDGHTVVIGGLFREVNDTGRGQVPGLGNAPLVGPLFRRQRDKVEREEIIILLTPHIIKDDKVYAEASDAAAKDAEKLRVGVRKGMMCFSRERLAEAAYERAVQEMSKPTADTQRALWHLNCATNLNPLFMEAISMKQRVTGKELSSVDNSSVRGFVKRLVLAEKPAPATTPAAKAEARPEPIAAATTRPTTAPAVAEADGTECDSAYEEMWRKACEDCEGLDEKALAGAPATRPSTQPVAVAPATQPSAAPAEVAGLEDQPLEEDEGEPAEMPEEARATTRPAGEDGPVVTELPTDDAAGK